MSLPLKKVSHTHNKSKPDATITFSLSLQWSLLMNPLIFHSPHLTLRPGGAGGLAGPRAASSDPRSAAPDPKWPATVAATTAAGAPAAAMLGEVGDLAQNMGEGGGGVGEDEEKVELWWAALSGSMVGVVLGGPSISPAPCAMDPRPKKALDMKVDWG